MNEEVLPFQLRIAGGLQETEGAINLEDENAKGCVPNNIAKQKLNGTGDFFWSLTCWGEGRPGRGTAIWRIQGKSWPAEITGVALSEFGSS